MTIGLFANLRKPKIPDVVRPFVGWLRSRSASVVVSEQLAGVLRLAAGEVEAVPDDRFAERCDVAVALGGDGTMLSLARLMGGCGKPIVGVNLGGLGFLAEVSVEDLYSKMEKVIAGDFRIEKRMVLETSVPGPSGVRTYHAMNDVVLDRGGSPRVLCIRVLVDREYFNTYYADGIIVATPTGSTAYSLSALGPIMVPTLESIILNPICPHTLTARPTVIPASSVVELQLVAQELEAQVSVDGQEHMHLHPGMAMVVKKGTRCVHLIQFDDHNFFDLLRRKLQWGSLPYK